MEIAFVNHTATVSGGEVSLLEVIPPLLTRGFRITLFCPPGELAERAARLGVTVVEVGELRLAFRTTVPAMAAALLSAAQTAARIRRHCARHGVSVLHANTVRAALIAMLARLFGGPRVIAHVRDVLPAGRPAALVRRLLCAGSDLVLANSRYTARSVRCPRGVTTVYSAVDLRRFAPTGARAMQADLTLGVLGQVTSWKAQDDAIRILALVAREHPRARLVVAGSVRFEAGATLDNQAYMASLHQLAEDLGVADHVSFTGHLESPEQLLGELDMLLVPSIQEPFGRVVVEAMAAGTPAIATAEGGPAEIIENGVNGVLLPPRDPARWAAAILALASDPGRWLKMSDRARERSASFSVEACADRLAGIYQGLERARPVAS